jgi:hypothetical protein
VSDGAIAAVLFVIVIGTLIAYASDKQAKAVRDHKLTRVQAAKCSDRTPKLCPSSHFCGSCERHW